MLYDCILHLLVDIYLCGDHGKLLIFVVNFKYFFVAYRIGNKMIFLDQCYL